MKLGGFDGPRGDRTPDLLIVNPTEGEAEHVSEGPSYSPDTDKPEHETR